ncbi:hypothetical protein HNR62_001025 [Oceanisphaera litoralis]|uniref:DUF4376 domain-containing protein n=1 Tax=Oceanisphaera litoralis TaxID=225144 RepID=UPI00195674E1|nr:DUF4376 domain-containing protein [Oceanisphaera litoralis]MBM7455165.1 hypothetical protein [Oceanisphaera litoralis]
MKIRHNSPERRARANQGRDRAFAAGMEWGGHHWQIDASSRAAIASRALRLMLDPGITTVEWRNQGNTEVRLSREQFQQLALAVDAHCEQIQRHCWSQKDATP